jgi:hypothetical protein
MAQMPCDAGGRQSARRDGWSPGQRAIRLGSGAKEALFLHEGTVVRGRAGRAGVRQRVCGVLLSHPAGHDAGSCCVDMSHTRGRAGRALARSHHLGHLAVRDGTQPASSCVAGGCGPACDTPHSSTTSRRVTAQVPAHWPVSSRSWRPTADTESNAAGRRCVRLKARAPCWFDERPLPGRRIVVTRSGERARIRGSTGRPGRARARRPRSA